MENEVFPVWDDRLFDVAFGVSLAVGMNIRNISPLKLEELLAEPKVDAGRLQLHVEILNWRDIEVAGLEPVENVQIREYHGRDGVAPPVKSPGRV